MKYSVTYRGNNGEVRTETVEASGRGECFAQCRARGISPMSVKEARGTDRSSRSKPTGKTGSRAPRDQSRQTQSSKVAVILVIVAAALIGGGVWWWFFSGREAPALPKDPQPSKPASLPKEVKPAKAAATVTQELAAVETPAPPKKRELTTQEKLERLEISLTNAYKAAAAKKIKFIPSKRRENRIFTEIADLQIQRLLSIEPGRIFLGTINYDKFEENFKKALKTPIEIKPDDPENVRAMKEAVIETRKDLKQRMDAGEDIGKVMRDTEDELHRLASYRFNLETELRKARGEGKFSGQDLKDYVDAANSMLRQNGLPELKYPEIWYHNAKLRQPKGKEEK